MMNRWNCRPKQKRGKSKRAERSIGFSPLIPAKQVHRQESLFYLPNRLPYRFLRKQPFIPSGCAIPFHIERPLVREPPCRFVHKAAFRRFSFSRLSIPSTGNRQDSPTLIPSHAGCWFFVSRNPPRKQPYGLVGRHIRLCRFHLVGG